MLHGTRDTIERRATVTQTPPPTTPAERLAHWATVLERSPERMLVSLPEVEHRPPEERAGVRIDGSALTLAMADPVLRQAGLTGDHFGQALDFFGLSEHEAHNLLCSCRNGGTQRAIAVADGIHALERRRARTAWMRQALARAMAPWRRATAAA
jgi:hypothetical protein